MFVVDLVRGGWSRRWLRVLVCQGLSSGGNALLTFVAAHQLNTEAFGLFAEGLVVYGVFVTLQRGSLGQYLLLIDGEEPARWAVGRALRWAGVALVVALMLGAAQRTWIIPAAGLAVAAVLVQDALRYVLIGRKQEAGAAIADGLWIALEVPLFVATSGHASGVVLSLVWGLGALCGIPVLVFLARRRRTSLERSTMSDRRGHRTLTIESIGVLIGGNIAFAALLVFKSADDAGAFRAGAALFSPLTPLVAALPALIVATAGPGHARIRRLYVGGVATLTAAAGGCALLSDRIGRALLGSQWENARETVPAFTIGMTLTVLATSTAMHLRMERGPAAALRPRVISAAAEGSVGVAGAVAAGPHGAALSLVGGQVVQLVLVARARRSSSTSTGTARPVEPSASGEPVTPIKGVDPV